ncbi:hypothetical protein [Aliagarivorans marinus]|uniref:hypothetical protein n=1 Tax=Aliagarivorans marinus TaxID=561965 RepID=UPI000478D1BC|nr:hypothetical protein [Aliagarivorans marinus]
MIKPKIWIVLAALALTGGLVFFGIAGKFYLSFLFDTDANPMRHEYLIGVALSVMLSIPFWVSASGFIYPIRAMVPKSLFWGVNITTILTVGAFFLVNILPLFFMSFGK